MNLVVDLDDTLVYTTFLNNDAYNFALERYGYPRLDCKNRITRKNLFNVKREDLQKIIQTKQEYFSLKWLPYRTILNTQLLDKVKQNGTDKTFLWTKANQKRVRDILGYFNLTKYFKAIIHDDKTDFLNSIVKFQKAFVDDTMVIYENESKNISSVNYKIIDEIKTILFDVKGYLINI